MPVEPMLSDEPKGSGAGTRKLVLASSSQRRIDYLHRLGVDHEVRNPDIDETPKEDESGEQLVVRLARCKASSVTASGEIGLGADTAVDLDGQIIGKPVDARQAREFLGMLSGRRHLVWTGVCLYDRARGTSETVLGRTEIEFLSLEEATIDWYVKTGESFGRAGAYSIQDLGEILVARIVGSYSNVVGLPLVATVALLRRHGIEPLL